MNLIIFPAIDLRNGQVVRLRQGDPAAQTTYSADPAAVARHWASQRAEWLHVVNLDGAFSSTGRDSSLPAVAAYDRHCEGDSPKQSHAQTGIASGLRPLAMTVAAGAHPHAAWVTQHDTDNLNLSLDLSLNLSLDLSLNLRRLAEIRAAVALPIQFGGGLRTVDDVALALALGATRVVLGTVAVRQPEVVAEAVIRFGAERIAVGIDARDGLVATHGWQESSALDALTVARRMADLGVRRVVFTDIARDGMLTGPNVAATAALARASGLKVIASGGVASLADLRALAAHAADGIEGAIVGQALYRGAIDLAATLSA